MRKYTRRRDDNAEVNMTPMLDIVFILLIFFIVTATFLQEEGIDMRPPPACTGSDCGEGIASPIVVQVDSESRVFVNQIATDIDRALSAVNRFRAEAPDAAVLLEVHDQADHGAVVQLWDEMTTNGVPVSIQRTQGDAA